MYLLKTGSKLDTFPSTRNAAALTNTNTSTPLGGNLTNAESKPYLWTVDNSPVYSSPGYDGGNRDERVRDARHFFIFPFFISRKWKIWDFSEKGPNLLSKACQMHEVILK
jgi:hypothetical protein